MPIGGCLVFKIWPICCRERELNFSFTLPSDVLCWASYTKVTFILGLCLWKNFRLHPIGCKLGTFGFSFPPPHHSIYRNYFNDSTHHGQGQTMGVREKHDYSLMLYLPVLHQMFWRTRSAPVRRNPQRAWVTTPWRRVSSKGTEI